MCGKEPVKTGFSLSVSALQSRIHAVKIIPRTSIIKSPVFVGFFTWMGTMKHAPFTRSSSVYASGKCAPKSFSKQNSSGTVSAEVVMGTPR